MDQPTFSGCLVQARLIGVIGAQQTETNGKTQRNDRLLAVPLKARRFKTLQSAKELDKRMIKEVERFFQTYNEEGGKKFKLLGIHGPNRAEAIARSGMKQFQRQQ